MCVCVRARECVYINIHKHNRPVHIQASTTTLHLPACESVDKFVQCQQSLCPIVVRIPPAHLHRN